jgi:hypothetical protein
LLYWYERTNTDAGDAALLRDYLLVGRREYVVGSRGRGFTGAKEQILAQKTLRHSESAQQILTQKTPLHSSASVFLL